MLRDRCGCRTCSSDMLGRRATLKTGQQHEPRGSLRVAINITNTEFLNQAPSMSSRSSRQQVRTTNPVNTTQGHNDNNQWSIGASECSANRITLWFQDKVITLWKETHGLKSHLLSNDRLGDPTATAIRSEGGKEFVNMFHAGVGTWKAYVTSDVQVVGVSSQRPALCSSPLFFFCATCDPRLV